MHGRQQQHRPEGGHANAIPRVCVTVQRTAKRLMQSGPDVFLQRPWDWLEELCNSLDLLLHTVPTLVLDAATVTALLQLNSCLLRVVLRQLSIAAEAEPVVIVPPDAVLGIWHVALHRSSQLLSLCVATGYAGATMNNTVPGAAAGASSLSRRVDVAVAILRSEALQVHAELLVVLMQRTRAAGSAIHDSTISVVSFMFATHLVDSIDNVVLLVQSLCDVAKQRSRAMACLSNALMASCLFANVCHALLSLVAWWRTEHSALAPDPRYVFVKHAEDKMAQRLTEVVAATCPVICMLMTMPELAPAALTPAVQYFAAAQLIEAAAAVDGRPTHGLVAPGMLQLSAHVQSAVVPHARPVQLALYPAASVLGSELYLQRQQQQAELEWQRQQQAGLQRQQQQHTGQEEQQQQQQRAGQEQQQQQDGGSARATAAMLQQPALFTPLEVFDLMVRGIDCMFREAAAAGQQAGSSAAGGSAAAPAGTTGGQQQHYDPQRAAAAQAKAARFALRTAVAALDALPPRQHSARLPRLWRAICDAIATAATTGWDLNDVFLLDMATTRLTGASALEGQSAPHEDTANCVSAEEVRAAHQEGFVRAWAAMLRWLGRACNSKTTLLGAYMAWPVLGTPVPALWRALQDAGAPPCELAQVAVALRKLAAFEAQLPRTTSPVWLRTAALLLHKTLDAARAVSAPELSGEQHGRAADEPGPGQEQGPEAAGANGQQQQQQQRALMAGAVLAMLPTLSAGVAVLLRRQLLPRAARRYSGPGAAVVQDALLLSSVLQDWYAQLVLDGACRLGPCPAAPAPFVAATAAAGPASEPEDLWQLQQPGLDLASRDDYAMPQEGVGFCHAASASADAALRGAAACAEAAAWRRYLCRHRHGMRDLAATMLEWAAAVAAAPGEGPLDQQALEELGRGGERHLSWRASADKSCSMLLFLEALEPGALAGLLACDAGAAAPATPAAIAAGNCGGGDAAGGGGASVPGPGRAGLRAALEMLARHQHKVATRVLEVSRCLADPEACQPISRAELRAGVIAA